MITIYHGTDRISAQRICSKDIDVSINHHRRLDFGPGFYTTDDIERAKMWALRKANTRGEKPAIVTLSFDIDGADKDNFITRFTDDLNWGQFVINNRNGRAYISKMSNQLNNLDSMFDITYGRVADVDVTDVADMLKRSELPLEDVNLILNPSYPMQYVFHTQNSISYIKKKSWRPA